MKKREDGARAEAPGSREPSPSVSAASGFDPSRVEHKETCPVCEQPLTIAPGIGGYCATESCPVLDDDKLWIKDSNGNVKREAGPSFKVNLGDEKKRRRSSSEALAENLRRQADSLGRHGGYPRSARLMRKAAREIEALNAHIQRYPFRYGKRVAWDGNPLIERIEMAIRDAIYDQFGILHTDGDCRAAEAAIALVPRDSDGSPKGGDGEAGSVHDSAAIAQHAHPERETDR